MRREWSVPHLVDTVLQQKTTKKKRKKKQKKMKNFVSKSVTNNFGNKITSIFLFTSARYD